MPTGTAPSRACLAALDAGDQEEFRASIGHIAAPKDEPLWPSMARALGLRPTDDWGLEEGERPEPTTTNVADSSRRRLPSGRSSAA